MPKAYINDQTLQQLGVLAHDLPQSIVFTGPEGVGLSSAVSYITDALNAKPLYILPEKEEKVDLEKGTISVDVIRRLYNLTKTVETGTRIVVIDYVERMGVQAQNAFLKLLEEPGVNTHFILLTHTVSRLLPTIQSRVQIVEIRPITNDQSEALLKELKVTDAQKLAQLLFIASGLPATLTTLSQEQGLFDARAQVIRDARSYLQGNTYERLKLALSYKDNREKALVMLLDAMKLLKASLKTGQSPDQVKKIGALLKAYERIEANGNVRLQLASVMVY